MSMFSITSVSDKKIAITLVMVIVAGIGTTLWWSLSGSNEESEQTGRMKWFQCVKNDCGKQISMTEKEFRDTMSSYDPETSVRMGSQPRIDCPACKGKLTCIEMTICPACEHKYLWQPAARIAETTPPAEQICPNCKKNHQDELRKAAKAAKAAK